MFNFQTSKTNSSQVPEFTWDTQATQALDQAVSQAPVPGLLKNRMKNELKKAAETHAAAANRTNVTPEDLMNGLLSKLPSSMKERVEKAMQKGPQGLKDLEQDLKNQQ